MLKVAALFTLSVFGLLLYLWTSFGGPVPLKPHSYRFEARFGADAANLVENAEVRIAGVEVGRVVRTERRRSSVDALIELEPRYAPIASDARAIVRSKTLLGEAFVELAPGHHDAPPLPENATLPASGVERSEQIDDVLGAFDAPTRRAFKRTLDGFARALDGRGESLNAALGHADPTARELDRLMAVLDRQQGAVSGLVRDSGRTLAALGRRDRALRELVRSADRVLSTTAERDRELGRTVAELPAFLRELRGAMREVDAAAAEAAPTVSSLRRSAPSLAPALDRSARLAPELEALVRRLDPTVPELRAALPAVPPVAGDARRLMHELDPAGRELVPVVRFLAAYRREAVASLANLGAATQGSAALPGSDGERLHYARALPLITSEQVFGHPERLPSNRYNPYPPPGAMASLGRPALRALDCRHTRNPQTLPVVGSAPPCLVQQPWSFQGRSGSFPRLERFTPSGR